jgi:hypothetical protein
MVRFAVVGAVVVLARAAGTPSDDARWHRLRSPAASATSFLQNSWNRYQENYHPSYVLDENPATAWVEGADGYGENESLTLPLSPLSSARALRLRIWNGYQKSKDLFAKNSAPRRVRVAVLAPTGQEVTAREVELARAWGPQDVVVDVPSGRGLSAVRLTILSVYPGTRYKDTCISDVLVDVDSQVPYNAAAEAGKLAALRAWVAGRKQTAVYFAARPPEFPFAYSKYEAKAPPVEVARAEFKRRFTEKDALEKELGEVRYKPVIKKPILEPDGLYTSVQEELLLSIDDFLQLFSLSEVALFETSEPLSAHQKDDEGGYYEHWRTSLRAARAGGPAGRIRLLQFGDRFVSTERTTSTSNHDVLLVYDEQGRLQQAFRESRDKPDYDFQWIRALEIFTFSYNAAGKVESVELLQDRSWRENDAKKDQHDSAATRIVFTGVADQAEQKP